SDLFEKDLKPKNTQAELARLVNSLQKEATIPLFIGIDEEGGRVNRLKPKYGFPKTVSAQYLGKTNKLDSTRFYADQTARTLYAYGINTNYAPDVDVNINPQNPVIGKVERSFSPDYNQVVAHARVVIEAHDQYRIATAIKHFPGHGSSQADTHLGIADVSNTWQMEELYPYKILIESGIVKGVMSAHIVNRTLDERKLPGTLSDKIIQGMLREHLGYDGVVFSDDMHMGAISKNYGFEEAVVLSINAGIDVLMFSNNIYEDEQTGAPNLHAMIRSKVMSGEISEQRIRESYQRIMKLKTWMGLLEQGYKTDLDNRLKTLY
ncbi:MAG: glycoside hydrolase family 3 protein, partial [Cyclobacteriaceae bacterium]|nr:glycoside hydrolase family 3 protein [Cyclobacteriaceae bacterium]